ncbi:ABC transporter permease [Candidatus Woesearchaeota archaeon]|nr:ABC transporter permease [Candidatus Woesearchaeota archaeon]
MNPEVTWMLCKRQLKHYWRSKSRMIGMLGQPLLFLVALGFGFGPVFQEAGRGDYMTFLAPGVIGMSVLFTAMFAGINVIWDRKFGFLKESLVAPVSRTNLLLGRTLGGALVATLQGVLVFILTLFVGFRPDTWASLIPAIGYMLLTALLFTALGTAIASRLEDMQAFPLIMNFIIMPLFFLSGALFPVKNLPQGLLTVVKLDPMSYAVDGLRHTLTGAGTFGHATNLLVLTSLTAIILLIGGHFFKKIEF